MTNTHARTCDTTSFSGSSAASYKRLAGSHAPSLRSIEALQLDAVRHALGAESARLIYAAGRGLKKMVISSGPDFNCSALCDSPFEWQGLALPKAYDLDDGNRISENIHYGKFGSASILRAFATRGGALPHERLISEHSNLHATLDESHVEAIRGNQLREREIQVLAHAAQGMTSKETAEHMNLNIRKIEYLLKTAKERLGARSLPEAVFRAICTRQLRL